jgi:hypothetical protein
MKTVDKEAFKAELAGLYSDLSKHSAYQSIPDFVARIIDYQVPINEDWRGDRVRLDYILSRLSDRSLHHWGDIGANTGFFSLSLANADPQKQVLAIEANPNHADFIRRIGEVFELANLQVMGRPIAIDDLATIPRQDVLLHLNVLHHAGADFDKGFVTGPDDFLPYAETYLRRLHACTRVLVFQVGTNLWGDKGRPIIDYREDAAKLKLLSQLLCSSGWHIDDVAYATRTIGGAIAYEPLSPRLRAGTQAEQTTALAGFDLSSHIGEFYRRPLFFCTPEP